jgi:hypothetical protein
MDYEQKYLKYKQKYLALKKLIGGVTKSTESNIHPLLENLSSTNTMQQKVYYLTDFLRNIYLTRDHKELVLTTIKNYYERNLNNLNNHQNFELISNLIFLVLSNTTTPENNIDFRLVRTLIGEIPLVRPYIEAKLRSEIARLRTRMTNLSTDHRNSLDYLNERLSKVPDRSYDFSGNVGAKDDRSHMLTKIQEEIDNKSSEYEIGQRKLSMEITLYENILLI